MEKTIGTGTHVWPASARPSSGGRLPCPKLRNVTAQTSESILEAAFASSFSTMSIIILHSPFDMYRCAVMLPFRNDLLSLPAVLLQYLNAKAAVLELDAYCFQL